MARSLECGTHSRSSNGRWVGAESGRGRGDDIKFPPYLSVGPAPPARRFHKKERTNQQGAFQRSKQLQLLRGWKVIPSPFFSRGREESGFRRDNKIHRMIILFIRLSWQRFPVFTLCGFAFPHFFFNPETPRRGDGGGMGILPISKGCHPARRACGTPTGWKPVPRRMKPIRSGICLPVAAFLEMTLSLVPRLEQAEFFQMFFAGEKLVVKPLHPGPEFVLEVVAERSG